MTVSLHRLHHRAGLYIPYGFLRGVLLALYELCSWQDGVDEMCYCASGDVTGYKAVCLDPADYVDECREM
jgi:hypothetical protein